MTMRLDINNIFDYLHNFNKNRIRQTKHSNIQLKKRKISFANVCKILNEGIPIKIEQQQTKKFALTYDYNNDYNLYIVIAIKDKFINIVTQHIDKK